LKDISKMKLAIFLTLVLPETIFVGLRLVNSKKNILVSEAVAGKHCC
jgi:hypothetical protein